MAQQILGADGSTIVKVDPTFGALRYTPRPLEASVGWFAISAKSGAMTGVGAGGCVYSCQYTGSNYLMVRKIQIGYITTAAPTAAFCDFGVYVARSFTVADSAQTALTLSGNTGKLRTSMTAMASTAIRISNTGAVTAGTRTLDTNPIAYYGQWMTAAAGQGWSPVTVFDQGPGDYPLVLAQNEGFAINCVLALPTSATGPLIVTVEMAETATSNWP